MIHETHFQDYIQHQKVLIVDPNASSRSSLCKILIELGVQTSKVRMARTYNQACEAIPDFKPHVVVAEYLLENRSGLELAALQREARAGDLRNCTFVLITSNPTQTAVALAAEEEVDAFIVKPFTQDSVRAALKRVVSSKANPSRFDQLLEAGKAALVENRLPQAEAFINEAIALYPRPSLAYYYLGQLKTCSRAYEEARTAYRMGLEFNPSHYKCTLGLLELHLEEKEFRQAYALIQKMSELFPPTPARLAEAIGLAVRTANYDDVEKYHAAFCAMEERDENLIRHVCAALVVAAKFLFNTGEAQHAVSLLRKAAISAAGRIKLLRDIIEALTADRQWEEALAVLKRFPAEMQSSADFMIARFHVFNAEGAVGSAIAEGRRLVREGLADRYVYTVMIERYLEAGLDLSVQELAYDAIGRFPDDKELFHRLLAKAQRA